LLGVLFDLAGGGGMSVMSVTDDAMVIRLKAGKGCQQAAPHLLMKKSGGRI
jgi:hypothetical protein